MVKVERIHFRLNVKVELFGTEVNLNYVTLSF